MLRRNFIKTAAGVFIPEVIRADQILSPVLSGGLQVPLSGLLAQFDMANVSGTLIDRSGHGNNGTLHGTTSDGQGTLFNGTSDWIAIPTLIGNSNFTVLIFANTVGTTTKVAWSESLSGDTFTLLSLPGDNAYVRNTANAGGGMANPGNTNWFGDWHCYILQRSGLACSYQVWDKQFSATRTLPGGFTVSTNLAALGCRRDTGSTQDLYYAGKVAYVLIYDSVLSSAQIDQAYSAVSNLLFSRGVVLPVSQTQEPVLSAGPIWVRQGVVMSATATWENGLVLEPSFIYDSNAQILSGNVFKGYYTGSTGGLGYAESSDGVTWTKYPSNPIVSGGSQSCFVKIGPGSYELYYQTSYTSSAMLKRTSADGISWSAPITVLTSGGSGAWDNPYLNNISVMQDPVTGLWLMFYEANNMFGAGGPSYLTGLATSPDRITWTKSPLNPISGFAYPGCQGPDVHYINGRYVMWCGTGGLPTDIFCRTALSLGSGKQFQLSPKAPNGTSFTPAFARGTVADEAEQVADPCAVEISGNSYLFYDASPSGSTGFVIKLATFAGSLAAASSTTQGATSTTP